MLDFSSNVNPLGPPAGLIEHLAGLLPEMGVYPLPQARLLREALARFLSLQSSRILVGNGASELIHLLVLWRRPRRVIVPAPTFSEYERAARLAGAAVEYYSLYPGRETPPEEVAARLRPGDLLVFCNPNNPTGILYPRKHLELLAGAASRLGAEMLVDESFIFLCADEEQSLRHYESPALWVVASLTKLWCLPGLRLGFLLGEEKALSPLGRLGDPWRVNSLAQEAGLYCLEKEAYREASLALIKTQRSFLREGLQAGEAFTVYPGAANYLLVRARDSRFRVSSFQDCLAREGFLIRRADNFPRLDERYFRVAVRLPEENRALLEAVARCWPG